MTPFTLRWHSKEETQKQGEARKRYVDKKARELGISEAEFIRRCIDCCGDLVGKK